MDFSFMELIVLALASFRLTRLVVYDTITNFIRKPFSEETQELNEKGEIETYIILKKGGIRGFIGELLNCYWCMGVWSSIILIIIYCLFPLIANPIILVLAVAGLAALIETIVQRILND